MKRYIAVSIAAGLLFALMDALINANPLAREIFSVYRPIARTSINAVAGIAIDLLYGFVLAGLFLILFRSLPGESGIRKGVSFGIIAWFLRIFMQAASTWVMFAVPSATILYILLTGLGEMVVLGVFFGMMLEPGDLSFDSHASE